MRIDGKTGEWICYQCNDAGNLIDLYGMVLGLGDIETSYFGPAAFYRIFSLVLTPENFLRVILWKMDNVLLEIPQTMEFLGKCRNKFKRDKFFQMEIRSLPDPQYRDILEKGPGSLNLCSTCRLLVIPDIEDGELKRISLLEPCTNTYVIVGG
jgi:hypothetical protein